MKKLFFYTAILLSPFTYSQDEGTLELNVEKLKLTSAPAYNVLGVEPENISRPSTPRGLATALQSAVVNGKLQPNFAMEFTPYYMFGGLKNDTKKYFRAEEYILDDNWARNLIKHFSISIATSSTDTVIYGNLKAGTGIGLGGKIMLFSGVNNKEIKQNYSDWAANYAKYFFYKQISIALKSKLDNNDLILKNELIDEETYSDILLQALKTTKGRIETSEAFTEKTKSEANKLIDIEYSNFALKGRKTYETLYDFVKLEKQKWQDNYTAALNNLNKSKNPFARDGLMIELAAAHGMVFQNNEWTGFASAKTSVWLTPSYSIKIPTANENQIHLLDILAVGRFTKNYASVDIADYYLDAGMKLQYSFNKFSLSYEGIGRYASIVPIGIKSKWTYRSVVNADYTLLGDITLKVTFGTNFDGNTTTYTDPKKIFAVAGINIGILDLIKPKK
jgi:hypothetical protein